MACVVTVKCPDLNAEIKNFVKGDLYIYNGNVVMCNENVFIENDNDDPDNIDFTVIYVNPLVEELEIGELVCESYTLFRRFTGTLTLSQEG